MHCASPFMSSAGLTAPQHACYARKGRRLSLEGCRFARPVCSRQYHIEIRVRAPSAVQDECRERNNTGEKVGGSVGDMASRRQVVMAFMNGSACHPFMTHQQRIFNVRHSAPLRYCRRHTTHRHGIIYTGGRAYQRVHTARCERSWSPQSTSSELQNGQCTTP